MVMDDSTKNINISLRSATLCRHFSYVLHGLYFIYFIIYLDTHKSAIRLLKDILACCNSAFEYSQHRQSNTLLLSSTRQLQCCYCKAPNFISQWEIHTDICLTHSLVKYSLHDVIVLVVKDLMNTFTDVYIYTNVCFHSCVATVNMCQPVCYWM